MGRSCQRRKAASRHYCAGSFVPFTVDGCIVSQAPVFVTRRIQWVTTSGAPVMVASSDTIAFATLFLRDGRAAVPRKSAAKAMASLEATITGAPEVITCQLRQATNTESWLMVQPSTVNGTDLGAQEW